MSEVTRIFEQLQQGDPDAAKHLFPLVYDELRKLAAEKMFARSRSKSSTQRPWYMKCGCDWSALSRKSILRIVATSLVQRRKQCGALWSIAPANETLKRGGDRKRIRLDQLSLAAESTPATFLALHEALDRLAPRIPVKRNWSSSFFTGLTIEQAAESTWRFHVHG